MGENLRKRLKMTKFEGPYHEAILALMVSASEFRANVDRVLGPFGVTGEQYNILRILRGAPEGHPCGEVADRMVDRSPDITRRIDALEKQGLVERERSRTDRRVVMTRITPKGIELLDKIAPSWHEHEKEFASCLTESEALELAKLCDKVIGSSRVERAPINCT
jgi:DNA-binding MarR family transcriptional regulator